MVPNLSRHTVLWVDDHPETFRSECAALREVGMTLDLVKTANQAVSRLSVDNQRYDLVIMDVILPDASPLAPSLAAVAVSAGLNIMTEHRGLVLGLWIQECIPSTRFFFYTIVPDAADQIVKQKLDPDGSRFIDKLNKEYYQQEFRRLVARMLGES